MRKEKVDELTHRICADYGLEADFCEGDQEATVLFPDRPWSAWVTSIILPKNRKSNEMGFGVYISDQYEGFYGRKTLAEEMARQARYMKFPRAKVEDQDGGYYISLAFVPQDPENLTTEELYEVLSRIRKLAESAIVALGGITWKSEYIKNEQLFSQEIIYPLLLRMDFHHIQYSHGRREYGRDFIFSETTPFGGTRFYGIQVKAGDIRGGVNSEIDEILGQLDDAFGMPFCEIRSDGKRYISEVVIAISGFFTDNAKDKIANKTPPSMRGSVHFVDRNVINELIQRYWSVKLEDPTSQST